MKSSKQILLPLAAFALSAPVHAQTPSPDELADLRSALESDSRPQAASAAPSSGAGGGGAQSMNPNIALILDASAAWFSEPDEAVAQAGAHDPGETGVNLQQLELHMDSLVDPFFRLDANLVFSQFGVEVEEVFATTLSLPAGLQVRGGQFLTRFGRLNPSHPHSWNFADQPLVNGKFFGGEGSRGLGVEASWLTPLPWFAEVVASAGQADGACCARSFWGSTDLGVRGPDDFVVTTALKQFFDLGVDLSALWGLSAQLGPNASGHGNRTEIYGTDLYVRYRPTASAGRAALSWQTEAMLRTRQVPGDALEDWGLYSQLVWNIDKRWEVGARWEQVEGVQDDPLDPEWVKPRRRTTVQWTFYPSHFSRLRLQGSRDDPPWRKDPTHAVFLALEVLIGAHGAHTF